MKLKETFILDLIKNNSGNHIIIPTDIKKLIQSYLPNPILIIQRAWRRYKHCTLKMDTIRNAYKSIDTICRQLCYIRRPGLVRHSSVSDPIQGNGEEWRCPFKNDLFSKTRRVHFLKLAKFLNESRKKAYNRYNGPIMPRNWEAPLFVVEHEDNNPFEENLPFV
jgi:tRNA uridine 5-carbamoylmethylation protein Kti12